MSEYKEVLSRRKFRLTEEVQNSWFDLLDETLTLVEVNISVNVPNDPDDAIFLTCAIAADADFLITGDTDLFRAETLPSPCVVTVATFKTLFCDVS